MTAATSPGTAQPGDESRRPGAPGQLNDVSTTGRQGATGEPEQNMQTGGRWPDQRAYRGPGGSSGNTVTAPKPSAKRADEEGEPGFDRGRRKAVIAVGLTVLAVFEEWRIGAVRKLFSGGGGTTTTQPPQPNGSATGEPTTPETPAQQQWWEVFPATSEQITGNTPGEVFKSFSDLIEWATNNPDGRTPSGLTAQELLNSVLVNGDDNIGALRSAIEEFQQLGIPMHQFDILALDFNDTLPAGNGGDLRSSSDFSLVANLDFTVRRGEGSPRDDSQVADVNYLHHQIYSSWYTNRVGTNARYRFVRAGNAWTLRAITPAG